jgi:ferredoxin
VTSAYTVNTLSYDPALCNGCGMCSIVCPHRVFTQNGREAHLAEPEKCMECGACKLNCPTDAIEVRSGVGCASAIFYAAITGKKEACCGGGDTPSCCS